MRAVLDTCVIIDALQNREGFSKEAQEIFLLCANDRYIGCITAKSATDIYYIMHRFSHDNAASKDVLNKLFALFEVLDTAGIDCKKALLDEQGDFEDAVMTETAIRSEADCIITRNISDFNTTGIDVYTPRQFLDLLETESDNR